MHGDRYRKGAVHVKEVGLQNLFQKCILKRQSIVAQSADVDLTREGVKGVKSVVKRTGNV